MIPFRNAAEILGRLELSAASHALLVGAPPELEAMVREHAVDGEVQTVAAGAIRSVKDRFDFILTCRHLLWRVQVKSAWCGPPYRIKGSGVSNIPYTVNEIDFVAGYIIPEDLWYILPLAALGSRKVLNINPHLIHRFPRRRRGRDFWLGRMQCSGNLLRAPVFVR